MRQLSIVFPVYNEVDTISKCVGEMEKSLSSIDYEIIIVEDGCTDGTSNLSRKLADRKKRVKHVHSDERLGKGKAIEKGFEAAEGEIIGFTDSDLSIDSEDVLKCFGKASSGHEIVIGSRYLESSDSNRGRKRLYLSKLYNKAADSMLKTDVTDHQCGLKLFHRKVWEDLREEVEDENWFWDTEFIYRAEREGFNVEEVGIYWKERSEASDVGLINGIEMFEKLIDIKMSEYRVPFDIKFGRFALIGALGALVNTAILYMLTEYLNLYYVLSSFFAVEIAIILMFFLNNSVTFENKKKGLDLVKGIFKSNIVRSFGIVVNISLLYALTEYLGIYFLISNLVAIFTASIVNFVGEKHFNWNY